MEITHAAASFSPQVTRPATKASAHSAADMQRLVRAAVQDTVLLLRAIAGAPRRLEKRAAWRPRRPRAPGGSRGQQSPVTPHQRALCAPPYSS